MKKNLRVLILEDQPSDVELVLHQLRQGGFVIDPLLADSEVGFRQALEKTPDIILADYNLPQFDALQALELLKESQLEIPYIVISGSIGEEKAVEIIREGATDYLLKDRLMRLGSAVGRALSEKELREQQRQTEQNLSDLNLQFQTLLNGIPDSLALLAPDLEVIWANKATERLSVRRNISTEGSHCYSLWHGRAHPCNDCPAKETFRTGQSTDKIISTADDRSYAVKIFPLKNAAGEVVKVIQWATDITEKKRLRMEAERSSRLASLGELSAGIAHEINNPNGIILLNIPVVKETFTDLLSLLAEHYAANPALQLGGLPYQDIAKELPHMIDEIEGASQQIKQIVDDLKNFVRGDRRQNFSPADLNQIVQAGVRLADNSLRSATNHLQLEYAEEKAKISCYQQQLVQVVVNLLSNACQALTNREQAIRIKTAVDLQKRTAMVSVEDQGGGMTEEQLDRITEPFYTTRRSSGGTGLGLSISAKIVSEHGGRLEFSSAPNQGTTAKITLPLAPEVRP